MMKAARRKTMASGSSSTKKPRKPYTISRPREKWTADEHERFLHSLLVFGRDWKTVEQFVGTKTATQIRSHAQKYFLKAHKLGLAAALPPPHPRRPAAVPPVPPTSTAATSTSGSCGGFFVDDHNATAKGSMAPATTSVAGQSVDCWPTSCSASTASAGAGAPASWPSHDDSFMATPPNVVPIEEEPSLFANCLLRDDTAVHHQQQQQLPLSPDDLRFAQVYRFVGDIFGSDAPLPVEAQLQRLHGADPLVVETILLVLSNLQDNLFDY